MSDELVTIEVDGRSIKAPKGAMLIEVTDREGIDIPRFCYHDKLSVAANCRMCLVEVERAPKPLPACATPVADGMKVHTRSAKALDAQRGTMEFLLINHPLDCPICDQGGECELQDVAMGYGGDISRYNEGKRVVRDKDIGPLIATDMTRCIHCTRCVRFGEEIAGIREMGATGRGEFMEIGTYIEHAISSELSANIIDLCPVGALTHKPSRYRSRSWEMIQYPGVAPHDCVGSNINIHVRNGEMVRVVPRTNEEINENWISDRDRFSYLALAHPERIGRPQIKREGRWRTVEWSEALSFASEGLKRIVERHGPEQLAALASASASVEELFLLQQLLRGLGSNNIDHRVNEVDFEDDSDAPVMPWLGQSIGALEQIDAALLIGSHIRHEQPLLAHRLRKAAFNGAKISLLNSRRYDWHLPLFEELAAPAGRMAHELAAIVNAAAALRSSPSTPEIEPEERHRAIARSLIEGENAALLLGSQLEADPQRTLINRLARRLSALTGATLGYLPSAANRCGAWLAGALPHRLPGGEVSAAPGLHAGQLLAQGHSVKGYLLLGVEPHLDAVDSAQALSALQQAEFVVSLSSFADQRLRDVADLLLPVAAFCETAGTLVNAEGHWQSYPAAATPYGESRPGWKVLRVLAEQLDIAEMGYLDLAAVRAAVQSRCQEVVLDNQAATGADEAIELPVEVGARANGDRSDLLNAIVERRIYEIDPLVRRAGALQASSATDLNAWIHPDQAAVLGLVDNQPVRLSRGEQIVDTLVTLSPHIAVGDIAIPRALGLTPGPLEIAALDPASSSLDEDRAQLKEVAA